jgi:hypothetical protein
MIVVSVAFESTSGIKAAWLKSQVWGSSDRTKPNEAG